MKIDGELSTTRKSTPSKSPAFNATRVACSCGRETMKLGNIFAHMFSLNQNFMRSLKIENNFLLIRVPLSEYAATSSITIGYVYFRVCVCLCGVNSVCLNMSFDKKKKATQKSTCGLFKTMV